MNSEHSARLWPVFRFLDWARSLQADESLPPGLRAVYQQTLQRFLGPATR